MEWRDWWRIGRRRVWLVLTPPLVAAIFILPPLFANPPPPSYRVHLRYTASQPEKPAVKLVDDYQDLWLTSELIVRALTSWAQSSSFHDEVERWVSDQEAASSLQGGWAVISDYERSIGHLELEAADDGQLAVIARAAIAVMRERAAHYLPQLSDTANITFLDAPQVKEASLSLIQRLWPVLQLGLAAAIGLAIGLAAEFADDRLHDPEDSRALGLPLLVTIPKERV